MAVQPRVSQESRVPLSRERVLRTAIGLADSGGIDSLTMRRLAQELGVEAMSLYHHVSNKDDILGGMAEMVVDEMELPEPGADWMAAIRTSAISSYNVLLSHPWAASLLLSSPTVNNARLRYMNALLGTLRAAGFSPEMTDHAYHALESHTMGFTLWVVGMNLGTDEDLATLATSFLAKLPRDELPHLAEHIEQHLRERSPEEEGEFAFGLDLILDGLNRLRVAS